MFWAALAYCLLFCGEHTTRIGVYDHNKIAYSCGKHGNAIKAERVEYFYDPKWKPNDGTAFGHDFSSAELVTCSDGQSFIIPSGK